MSWYVQVCTGMYLHILMCWYELVCKGLYWYVLAYDWYESVQTRMYKYVLVHTSIFCKFWFSLILPCPLLDTRRYQAVQGSTRKSCTPGYAGTRKYMKVQGLVPSCTSLYLHIQGYRTFWYCHVPHCTNFTALYGLVLPCIQKRTRGYKAV